MVPIAIAETVVSHEGAAGLAESLALCASFPAMLFVFGFLTRSERSRIADLLRPEAIAARVRSLREQAEQAEPLDAEGRSRHLPPETYGQADRDSDRGEG